MMYETWSEGLTMDGAIKAFRRAEERNGITFDLATMEHVFFIDEFGRRIEHFMCSTTTGESL